MLTTVILTIFGADRPGLVEAISACASKHGANWLESRMLHLGGCFTGIARLEVEESARADLLEAMKTLSDHGLQVVTHDAGAGLGGQVSGAGATIEIVGHDRPGIVRDIARALSARAVNVEELSTERSSAPMTGELIFKATAEVRLPPGLVAADVKRELEGIAADLMVDLQFRES
jgi:glycine cleavage system regulatory protein